MKELWFIISVIIFLIALYFAFNNRENEKVSELFATSIIIGVGAALLSMTFILKSEENENKYLSSVTVLYNKHQTNIQEMDLYRTFFSTSNAPSIPYCRNLLNVKQFYYQSFPDQFQLKEGELKDDLYFQILIYSIMIDLFNQFGHSWTSNVEFVKTPTGVTTRQFFTKDSVNNEISWEQLINQIDLAIFKEFQPGNLIFPADNKLHLPPKSNINISSSVYNFVFTVKSEIGSIELEVIKLSASRSMGEIGRLLNINDDCATYVYEIKVKTNINKWKSGHPDVKLYKNWFKTINTILNENYSYDKYLSESKEWYMMYGKK